MSIPIIRFNVLRLLLHHRYIYKNQSRSQQQQQLLLYISPYGKKKKKFVLELFVMTEQLNPLRKDTFIEAGISTDQKNLSNKENIHHQEVRCGGVLLFY